ncbi:MAG: HAD family hydrolase [Candidatus Bathyarchaeia archaeon]
MVRHIKTVLLDYDNTLHNSDSKFAERLEGILPISGAKLWELYCYYIHRELVHEFYPERHDDGEFHCKLLFKYLGIPYDRSSVRRILEGYYEAEVDCWRNPTFYPETFHFLNMLKDRGYKLCLATGSHAQEKVECVEKFGSRVYFELALEEKILGYRKSDPRFYSEALEFSNSQPGETVTIGDNLTHDILPAKAVGVKAIWVNRRGERVFRDQTRPDHEVKDLLAVLRCLDEFLIV